MGLPKDADAVLLFEVDGVPEAIEKETENITECAKKYGAREVKVAKDQAEADKYWAGRRAGFAAIFGAAPTVMGEDVTVPRNKIPDLINKVKAIAKKHDITIAVIGHAGDGNLHPSVLTDIKNKEHYDRAMKAIDEIMESAVELGGVISGEHGIGLEKQKYFRGTVDPVAVDLMIKIKKLLDPNNIMNPNKIWD
jgi:glycolate oxidase